MVEKRRRSCKDTQGVDSPVTVTVSGVLREKPGHIWLGRPCCTLSWDRASTLASRPITRVDRKTYYAEGTGCSSEEQHALPTQEVAAIFLCHLCDHPHSSTCPVVLRLFVPLLFCCFIFFRS